MWSRIKPCKKKIEEGEIDVMLMVTEEGWSKFSPRDKGERVQSSLQKNLRSRGSVFDFYLFSSNIMLLL